MLSTNLGVLLILQVSRRYCRHVFKPLIERGLPCSVSALVFVVYDICEMLPLEVNFHEVFKT